MIFLELSPLFSSLMIGLLTGSLLTEACILVPQWRAMDPKEFLALYRGLGPKLNAYFAPITILATLFPVIAAVWALILEGIPRWFLIAPAAINVFLLILYFLYFKGANTSFETGSVGVDGVEAALKKWSTLHWVRVVLGMIAFASSLLALVYVF